MQTRSFKDQKTIQPTEAKQLHSVLIWRPDALHAGTKSIATFKIGLSKALTVGEQPDCAAPGWSRDLYLAPAGTEDMTGHRFRGAYQTAAASPDAFTACASVDPSPVEVPCALTFTVLVQMPGITRAFAIARKVRLCHFLAVRSDDKHPLPKHQSRRVQW